MPCLTACSPIFRTVKRLSDDRNQSLFDESFRGNVGEVDQSLQRTARHLLSSQPQVGGALCPVHSRP